MARLSFEIAKKLQKPQKGAPGLTLRSLQLKVAVGEEPPAETVQEQPAVDGQGKPSGAAGKDAASQPVNQVIVLADDYGMIKEQARNTEGIRCRAIGKSLRISSDDPRRLADFAAALPFNSEEALDVFEYLKEAMRDGSYSLISASLEPGALSVLCEKEFEGEKVDPSAAQEFYSGLSSKLDRYSMGIIK